MKSQIQVGLNAVGKIYCVWALLQNARTYLYGNQISVPCSLCAIYLLRVTCFPFYIITYKTKKVQKVHQYFPTLPNLCSRKSKKSWSDILKTSCKSFPMKFLEVIIFWKIKWNFMKEFFCEQKKKIKYSLWSKT